MRRRWVMQGVLCAVLAMALGVAALVSRRAGPRESALGEVVTIDGLRFARVEGWSLERDEEGLVLEEGRGASASPRQLRIRHSRSAVFLSPMEHLVRGGEIGESEAKASAMMTIGGWPGSMVWQRRGARGEMRRRVMACAVMDGDVIVLRLDGDDEGLLRRFAQNLKIAEQGEVKVGGELQLWDGNHLKSTDGWIHAIESDPLRVGRRLVRADGGAWMGVELTQCLARPGEEQEELAAMMRLRDPQLRAAGKMRKVGDRMWVCERVDSTLFGVMAALLTTADGQAVLAEFRWDTAGPAAQKNAQAVARLQSSLLEQVQFGQAIDLKALLERGIEARKALPDELDQAAGFAHSSQWQWLDEISSRTSPLEAPAAAGNGVVDRPANFVAGALLPVVLEHLPLEPMILSTDWMPGMAAVAKRPILLRLEPAFDMPRTLPGAADPMRCWNVEVNGSGESSRWYLDEMGKVEVIVFAGKRVLQRL